MLICGWMLDTMDHTSLALQMLLNPHKATAVVEVLDAQTTNSSGVGLCDFDYLIHTRSTV